jgi:two-component system CheB/CheR fusion protein
VSAPSKKIQPLRIFVVEDHADTLKYLSLYLETAGHTVFQAGSLEAALEAIPKTDCDVLISDVALPDGDGWQLLHKLKEAHLPHPAYAIIMSGFGTLGDRAKSAAAGFRHHILKPFNPRELAQILKDAAEEAKLKQR